MWLGDIRRRFRKSQCRAGLAPSWPIGAGVLTPVQDPPHLETPHARWTDDRRPTLDHDLLFKRLVVIQRTVANGSADPGSVAAWNALRDGVEDLVADLATSPGTVSRADGERRIRAWIQRFVDQHWPTVTWH